MNVERESDAWLIGARAMKDPVTAWSVEGASDAGRSVGAGRDQLKIALRDRTATSR